MIYLACPYTHPDPKVREQRFLQVNKTAAKLISLGYGVFSPISQCHPIAQEGELPTSWEYWKEYDEKILSICSELCILTLDGWRESKGIQGEVKIAREKGIFVTTISPLSCARLILFF